MPVLDHATLMARARLHRPERLYPNATSFSSWVHGLYVPEEKNRPSGTGYTHRERQIIGALHHRLIEEYKLWMKRQFALSGMEIVYSSESVPAPSALSASVLQVEGQLLRCVPDLVFKDRDTEKVVIVERKLTFVPEVAIPNEGWPDMRAQLWCYAWIDDWFNASEVFLVGEIWRHDLRRRMNIRTEVRPLMRRSDSKFHAQNVELFRAYGGYFLEEKPA